MGYICMDLRPCNRTLLGLRADWATNLCTQYLCLCGDGNASTRKPKHNYCSSLSLACSAEAAPPTSPPAVRDAGEVTPGA